MNFTEEFNTTFTDELFPESRTNEFFEALFGDAEEGAYTIKLRFHASKANTLLFHFELHQRGQQCLRCNLTTGLPAVFQRHPLIGAQKLAESIAKKAGFSEFSWRLGATVQQSEQLHYIPFYIEGK